MTQDLEPVSDQEVESWINFFEKGGEAPSPHLSMLRYLKALKAAREESELWRKRAYEAAGPPKDCICVEWDGQGRSVCGAVCPVHYDVVIQKLEKVIKLQDAALEVWKKGEATKPGGVR